MRAPRAGPMIVVSYLTLRRAIGILGIALPIILFTWGMLAEHRWLDTISAYYSLRARDALVGCLCTIGCFLFTYHGHDHHDNPDPGPATPDRDRLAACARRRTGRAPPTAPGASTTASAAPIPNTSGAADLSVLR